MDPKYAFPNTFNLGCGEHYIKQPGVLASHIAVIDYKHLVPKLLWCNCGFKYAGENTVMDYDLETL